MLSAVLKKGARVGIGGVASLSVASTAATMYAYQTDESWKRCIDFHILVTPMCWDYYKFYQSQEKNRQDEEELARLHKKYAPEALSHILTLGGYYVKCGQMFCGMGLLPKAYEDEFSCLLDGVPAKDFKTVREIIREELGGDLEDHFAFFDKEPIAAASIGQVHCATLHGSGEDVVVKVQYPEVERFFRLDVLSMQNLCKLAAYCGVDIGMDQANLDKMFDEFTKSFQEEFDYRLEAENMTLIANNMSKVSQFKDRVRVPRPVQHKTTKKVLTMERLRGEPIKKRMNRMMQESAEKEGISLAELEREMKAKFEDPAELQKLISQKPPSSRELFAYRLWMRAADCVTNTGIWIRNQFSPSKQQFQWSTLPLDASRIVPLLFDVHAHQLFVDGAFNGDPHSGNILICEEPNGSYTLGLIDFGNVQKVPSKERRESLAKFYLAMSKDVSEIQQTWNDKEIAETFVALAGDTTTGDVSFIVANALIGYDMRLDAATLSRFGIEADMSNLADLYSIDSYKEFPADLINLQRLCQTLVGVASTIGAGQPSCARMWQRQCEAVVTDASN